MATDENNYLFILVFEIDEMKWMLIVFISEKWWINYKHLKEIAENYDSNCLKFLDLK